MNAHSGRYPTFLILAVLCVVLAFASPASALTVSVGTATSSLTPVKLLSLAGLTGNGPIPAWMGRPLIEAHHEPYWEKADFVTGAAGLAWWGNIRVDSSYAPDTTPSLARSSPMSGATRFGMPCLSSGHASG
jgi:hypothetical protein